MARRKAIELHCHLDGCVLPGTIETLAHEQGIELPLPAAELATVTSGCRSLVEYIGAIEVALKVLQTPDALFRAATELVNQWAADGVLHGEARFAPELHLRKGMTMADAVAAVAAGLQDGSTRTGVDTSLILSCMRPSRPDVSWQVVEVAANLPDVIGVDVAGPEVGVPLVPHADAFRAAKATGLRVTVHAGEADSAREVWEAIDELGAERIGHGVKSIHDPALVRRLAKDSITLEICPTSNVQTTAVRRLPEHPVERLRLAGVPISLSTDCRTTSGVTIEDEYRSLQNTFGWDSTIWNDTQRSALRAAFIPRERRAGVDKRFDDSFR